MPIEIILEPELGKFVEEKVRSGEFSTPSDVVGSALAILKERESTDNEESEELRRQVYIGVEEFERGDCAPWNVEETKALIAKADLQRD